MKIRQQVLYLWLAEGTLETSPVGWAFHDGTAGLGPRLPDGEPPYASGVAALEEGWMLLQSPAPHALEPGQEHGTSYLANEFIFERRIEIAD